MDTVTVAIVISTQVFVLIAMCYIIRVLRILVVDYQQELRGITAELEQLEQRINQSTSVTHCINTDYERGYTPWPKTDAKTDTATVTKENFPSAE